MISIKFVSGKYIELQKRTLNFKLFWAIHRQVIRYSLILIQKRTAVL